MGTTKTRPWDVVDSLTSDERIEAYLEAALEEGDAALVAAALGDIARAKGMSEIARLTGLGRESLYKALSPDGNPILRCDGRLSNWQRIGRRRATLSR